MRVIILQVIRMHQHHILARLRTLHHLHSLTHSIRTEDAVLLYRQDHTLEFPVHQVVRRIASKAWKGIGSITLIFSKEPILSAIPDDAGTMGIHRILILIIPRDAIVNSLQGISPTSYQRIQIY